MWPHQRPGIRQGIIIDKIVRDNPLVHDRHQDVAPPPSLAFMASTKITFVHFDGSEKRWPIVKMLDNDLLQALGKYPSGLAMNTY